MKVRQGVFEAVCAHVRESYPKECCGILLAEAADLLRVTAALRAENADQAHPESAYVLGHRAHIEAVRQEAASKARIAGYYHSHPHGPAVPSGRDGELALEGAVYLIVGLRSHKSQVRAWRLEEGGWVSEPLEVCA